MKEMMLICLSLLLFLNVATVGADDAIGPNEVYNTVVFYSTTGENLSNETLGDASGKYNGINTPLRINKTHFLIHDTHSFFVIHNSNYTVSSSILSSLSYQSSQIHGIQDDYDRAELLGISNGSIIEMHEIPGHETPDTHYFGPYIQLSYSYNGTYQTNSLDFSSILQDELNISDSEDYRLTVCEGDYLDNSLIFLVEFDETPQDDTDPYLHVLVYYDLKTSNLSSATISTSVRYNGYQKIANLGDKLAAYLHLGSGSSIDEINLDNGKIMQSIPVDVSDNAVIVDGYGDVVYIQEYYEAQTTTAPLLSDSDWMRTDLFQCNFSRVNVAKTGTLPFMPYTSILVDDIIVNIGSKIIQWDNGRQSLMDSIQTLPWRISMVPLTLLLIPLLRRRYDQ